MCCDATQLILYSIIVCTNSVYSLASLFLPTVFKEKDIPGFWTGLVFSMYSIAVVIVSPFVGTMINKVGLRKYYRNRTSSYGSRDHPDRSLERYW